jgi:hypothetical protein
VKEPEGLGLLSALRLVLWGHDLQSQFEGMLMKTITIIQDDAGMVSVDIDGQVSQYEDPAEALMAVENALMGGEMDGEAVWAEEAAARPDQPNLMK